MRRVNHKFGAKKCERNGIKFPSKLERNCYDYLTELKKRGEVLFFLRQVPFDLPGCSKHVIDFCLFMKEDVIFLEAKGRDLPMGKMKRLQVEDIYNIKVHVVTKAAEIDEAIRINREEIQ